MALARRSPGAVRHSSAGARMARQGDPRGMSAIERFAAPGKAGRLGRVASIIAIGSALRVDGIDVDGAIAALRTVGLRAFFGGFLPQASFAPGTDAAIIERALDGAVTNRDVETVVAVSTTALTSDSR